MTVATKLTSNEGVPFSATT